MIYEVSASVQLCNQFLSDMKVLGICCSCMSRSPRLNVSDF